MSQKNSDRAREAQKRRRHRNNWRFHIPSQPPSRTLKSSARKQLERQRAPQLWISPWSRDTAWRLDKRVHPPATLLGLPPELRQQILYETCSMPDLEEDLEAEHGREREYIKNHSSTDKGNATIREGTSTHTTETLALRRREGELVALLGLRIGTLCCVAPQIRLDMQHVIKSWQRDLGKYVAREHRNRGDGLAPRLPVAAEGYEWLFNVEINARTRKGKQGQRIEAKSLKVPGKRLRPRKCWHCTERHCYGDPVCPLERKDPAKWLEVTKKVGGWRDSAQPNSIFMGTKIVFDDD